MNRRSRQARLPVRAIGAFAALALVLAASRSALGVVIEAGIDTWMTRDAGTFLNLGSTPIPVDFFGPASDAFTGRIELRGLSIPIVIPADTIVARLTAVNPHAS